MTDDLEKEEAPNLPMVEGPNQGSMCSNTSIDTSGERTKDALAFLRRLRPNGPWQLHRFGEKPRAYLIQNEHDLKTALQSHPDADWYVLIGELRHATDRKPKKTDMAGSRWVWIDIDPLLDPKTKEPLQTADELEALLLKKQPHVIVRSGRGVWGLWQLSTLGLQENVEAVNRQLANTMGAMGDACHNIDRVMRLPGTINSKTGRVAAWRDLGGEPKNIEDLPKAASVEHRTTKVGRTALEGFEFVSGLEDCDDAGWAKIAERLRMPTVIFDGVWPVDPADVDVLPDTARKIALAPPLRPDGSRNEAAFSFLQSCLSADDPKLPQGLILGMALCEKLPISDFFLREKDGRPKKGVLAHATKQLQRAWNKLQHRIEKDLERSENGKPLNTPDNFDRAISLMGLEFHYDEFADEMLAEDADGRTMRICDNVAIQTRVAMERDLDLRLSKDRWWDLAKDLCLRNLRNPAKDYLLSLDWDGEPRAERWLVDLAGAEDTEYVRAVSRIFLVAAVRRVMEPGCKFDELVVLEGVQGGGKSTALRRLAVRDEWFTDNLPLIGDSKLAIEQTRGKWIVEAAELRGQTKEDEKLKGFLSMQSDRARLAYDKTSSEVPRKWVPIGTTNQDKYLTDPTGNRRYWPIKVGEFDLERLNEDLVDQLWAEAACLEREGASIRLDKHLWAVAAEQQNERMLDDDPWLEAIVDWIGDRECKVRTTDVFEFLGVKMDKRSGRDGRRVGRIMRGLGFERKSLRDKGVLLRWYVRGDNDTPEIGPSSTDDIPF